MTALQKLPTAAKPQPTTASDHPAPRLKVRGQVQIASDILAPYWPIRTFIACNSLHGFEHLPFEQAVAEGQRLFKGQGYLSLPDYRTHYQQQRVTDDDLQAALKRLHSTLTYGDPLPFGTQAIHRRTLLCHQLVWDLNPLPAEELPAALALFDADDTARWQAVLAILRITPQHLDQAIQQWHVQIATRPDAPLSPSEYALQATRHAMIQEAYQHCLATDWSQLGYTWTLGDGCEQWTGEPLTAWVNQQMIKWCAAFLDEGQATWPMPHREKGFYNAWRMLAPTDASASLLGIPQWAAQLRALPNQPEEAIALALHSLRIPQERWTDYLTLHLAALPGWASFIKWRSKNSDYPWQRHHPTDLVEYLAIRLFYEWQWVTQRCKTVWGIEGHAEALHRYFQAHPAEYLARATCTREMLINAAIPRDEATWAQWAWHRYCQQQLLAQGPLAVASRDGWRLFHLAKGLGLTANAIATLAPETVHTTLTLFDGLSAAQQAAVWQEAMESHYRQSLFQQLSVPLSRREHLALYHSSQRPDAQAVFCIDVRSEGFRRHLEALGNYETFGFAGFFAFAIKHQEFNSQAQAELCPVLLKAKHVITESPIPDAAHIAQRHVAGSRWLGTFRQLLHDLKHNVATPFALVESIGILFSLPLLGKTLFTKYFSRISDAIKRWLMPEVATQPSIDKLPPDTIEQRLAEQDKALMRTWLQQQYGAKAKLVNAELLENLRQQVLGLRDDASHHAAIRTILSLNDEQYADLVEKLHHVLPTDRKARQNAAHAFLAYGFALDEQVLMAETALRLMGLTGPFAPIVLLCGHGSLSENNPYESSLDCGACGGNHGGPNARVAAAVFNSPHVRAKLVERGISIPDDTWFIAGEHNTTTDAVELFDLHALPASHRARIQQFDAHLKAAGARHAQERCAHLSLARYDTTTAAVAHVEHRSRDWAQVRPEWALARNAAFIVAKRSRTAGLNLGRRTFLHSYDHTADPNGTALEVIMTAPLVVAQWINLQYYFSTVDNAVYGSGNKVIHNVVGRVGVMLGNGSDLQLGLPWQSVADGTGLFHEPLRLTAVIEAPLARMEAIIKKHSILQKLFGNGWITLVALNPDDGEFYRYLRNGLWEPQSLLQLQVTLAA